MNAKKKTRRQFTDEFKKQAVARVVSGNERAYAVAHNLGVVPSVMKRWILTFADEVRSAGAPQNSAPSGEVEKLDSSPRQLSLPNPDEIVIGPTGRRSYSLALKERLIRRVQAGESVPQVSRATGVDDAVLRRWVAGVGVERGLNKDPRRADAASVAAAQPTSARPAHVIDNSVWGYVMDAFLYLRNMEKELQRMQQSGEVMRLDDAHLLAMLALRTLSKATGRK